LQYAFLSSFSSVLSPIDLKHSEVVNPLKTVGNQFSTGYYSTELYHRFDAL
jgi:hypothetical protein